MNRKRPLLAAVVLTFVLGATGGAQAQPRQLGPPPGVDLEGSSEAAQSEKSEKSGDAPVPQPPPSTAPAQPSPSGTAPSTTSRATRPDAAKAGSGRAADLSRSGTVSDTDIPLDLPLDKIPNYRGMMRDIVQELSRYARGRDPNFVVVSRPGFDLLTWSQREFDLDEIKRDPTKIVPVEAIRQAGAPMTRYIQAIDGFVLNGHFCAPLRVPRSDLAAARGQGLKALSVDHCASEAAAVTALQTAAREGFIAFAEGSGDLTLSRPPRHRPIPENPGNVEALGAAKNMLMLLSARSFASRDDWLAALQSNNYDVLIIDAFDRKDQPLTKSELHQLKFKEIGARRLVLARLDVANADESKFYWQRDWEIGNPSWIVGANPDMSGSYALEFWNPAWKAIVGKYLAGIMDLGFDGVMLDGVEAYRRWEAKTPLGATR